ncbi:hypothetical protein G6719_03940 [Polynucleobacter paneuropaeus]|nr:hypothetical protein G6719_03940 [Polynucleobacter paneuropaeus]
MDFDDLTIAGLHEFLHGDYIQSELTFIKASELEPNDSTTLVHLASAQIQLKKYELAEGVLKRSIEIDPKNFLAWFRLGQSYYSCQRAKEAVEAFGQAIAIKSDYADAWFMGGQALLLDGCINDGMTALKTATNLQPSSVIFNEILGKNFLAHKKDVGTLIISGGIGDMLLCVPFLLEHRHENLKVRVFSHFKGAEQLFKALSIPIEQFTYFLTENERQRVQEEINLIRESYSCPKRWFMDQNPFTSKQLGLDPRRKTIGIQLGGSAISIAGQNRLGIPVKALPTSLLNVLLDIDKFNIILFGSKDEINSYNLEKNEYLQFANFDNIDESLSLVSQCDYFVGSDSSIKALAAMLQIPSLVWLGDYQDQYRDQVFIEPYTRLKVMDLFKYKNIENDFSSGIKSIEKFLSIDGLNAENKIINFPQKQFYDNNTKKIVWFDNFPNGRFANALFQYIFAKYIEETTDYQVIIGSPHKNISEFPWILFDLPNHFESIHQFQIKRLTTPLLLGGNRSISPEKDREKIITYFQSSSQQALNVDGYFQYDTQQIKLTPEYKAIFEKYLSLTSNPITPFQNYIKNSQKHLRKIIYGKTLISIHVRRGDYLHFASCGDWRQDVFYPLHLENVLGRIREYLVNNCITNGVIYIASDDLPYCKQFFQDKGISILTNEDILKNEYKTEFNRLIMDIAALASSDLFIGSNSSLSIMAALLNETGRVFWRPTKNGDINSFDPWSTPILFGPVPDIKDTDPSTYRNK